MDWVMCRKYSIYAVSTRLKGLAKSPSDICCCQEALHQENITSSHYFFGVTATDCTSLNITQQPQTCKQRIEKLVPLVQSSKP